jgi:uncharacterized protein (DUF58 family)
MENARKLNIDAAGKIAELQSAVQYFEIKTKLYKTLLQGKGLEFDGFRVYAPSDDASSIDWKSSKRANELLVKQYAEERDYSVIFLIDVGEHMVFGSTEKLKCEYGAEIAASLASLMVSSRDKVGFGFFNNKMSVFIPPQKGMKHFYSCVEELSNSSLYGGKSDIMAALNFSIDYLNKSISLVIIISDFIKFGNDAEKALHLLGAKYETIGIMVKDPLDKALPNLHAEIVIENPETGEQMILDPVIARKRYEEEVKVQESFVRKAFRESGADLFEITSDKDFVPSLAEFLDARTKRRGGL